MMSICGRTVYNDKVNYYEISRFPEEEFIIHKREREMEEFRLAHTMEGIRKALLAEENLSQGLQKNIRDALQYYWENVYANVIDEAQTVETLERHRQIGAFVDQNINRLKRLAESPYFGRIDFRELGYPTDAIYIGIANFVHPESKESLIFDWRAPIAGMYYDVELGPAEYQSPQGTVSGEVMLKRHFKIADGQFVYMFDCSLKIDDEILQAIMAGRAGDKMRNVVASIQREQNRIIRDDSQKLLLVEGPAGSGKTSVALHRVAYLLYKERATITAKNILIFSPNRIFSGYISNVLPELGEENMLQTTFMDYIRPFRERFKCQVETWHDQMEYLLSSPETKAYWERTASIRFKSSEAFRTLLRSYLRWLEESYAQSDGDIVYRGHVILGTKEWRQLFMELYVHAPISRRLQQMKRIVQERLHPLEKERAKEIAAEIANTGEHVNEKEIMALGRLEAREELQPFRDELDRRTDIDPIQLYKALFEDEKLIKRLLGETALLERWNEVRRRTVQQLTAGNLAYEDLLPLLIFIGELEGFHESNVIRHLIIDEAQDYTTLQYELLGRVFPKSAWTVLGDHRQSVHPYLHTADFHVIAGILGMDDAPVISLSKSYRSTKEIFAFAQALLIEEGKAETLNRPGEKPLLISASDKDQLMKALADDILALSAQGHASIAIIGKTQQACEGIHTELAGRLDHAHLVTLEDEDYIKGIVVIPIYLAKGLEFDAVLIADADEANYNRDWERNLLYTACTRALRTLHLYSQGEGTPFIRSMDKTLYDSKRF